MKKTLKFLCKELALFLIGGLIYILIEIGARGFSHWSMFILGGICFISIGLLNEFFDWDKPTFVAQTFYGSIIITLLEFITGCIVNIELKWNIWDYSEKPFNLLGQICLENCCYWIILSAIAILVDDYLRYYLFHEEKPHYKFL